MRQSAQISKSNSCVPRANFSTPKSHAQGGIKPEDCYHCQKRCTAGYHTLGTTRPLVARVIPRWSPLGVVRRSITWRAPQPGARVPPAAHFLLETTAKTNDPPAVAEVSGLSTLISKPPKLQRLQSQHLDTLSKSCFLILGFPGSYLGFFDAAGVEPLAIILDKLKINHLELVHPRVSQLKRLESDEGRRTGNLITPEVVNRDSVKHGNARHSCSDLPSLSPIDFPRLTVIPFAVHHPPVYPVRPVLAPGGSVPSYLGRGLHFLYI